MKLLVFLALAILTLRSSSFDSQHPQQFGVQLSQLVLSNFTILQHNIGTTTIGNNITAYGLTAIPNISTSSQLQSFSEYPSALIISYMHNTEKETASLIYGYVMHIIKNFQMNDQHWQYILNKGIIWLVPYIRIDANETIKVLHSQEEEAQNFSMKNTRKLNVHDANFTECQKLVPPKSQGINLNYNFLKQIGKEYNDVCDEKYAGPMPFSQRQSLAIQKLFNSLTINAVIDLQAGRNTWVYPCQQIWNNSNHEYAYRNVIRQVQRKFHSIVKQPTQKYTDNGNQQQFTGGFVNWAALQGALAFRFEILNSAQPIAIQQSMISAIPVMDMIIKKNAPLYNKYRNKNNTKLYLQSLSLSNFSILSYLIAGNGESIAQSYQVGVGEVVQVSVEMVREIQIEGRNVSYRLNPQIRLYVNDTRLWQTVDLNKLHYITALNNDQISLPTVDEDQVRKNLYAGGFVIAIMFIIFTMPIIVDQCQKRKAKHKNLGGEQEKKKVN